VCIIQVWGGASRQGAGSPPPLKGQAVQQYTSIDYAPEMDHYIRNAANLPRGTGARYLLCLYVSETELVAKSWHRKFPNRKRGEAVVVFGGNK
jgi:hypothetical protein